MKELQLLLLMFVAGGAAHTVAQANGVHGAFGVGFFVFAVMLFAVLLSEGKLK